MDLHPYLRERVDAFRVALAEGASSDDLHDVLTRAATAWSVPTDVEVEPIEIAGRGGAIDARLYRRSDGMTDAPVVMLMHGGGFSSGDMVSGEAHGLCAELASRTGAICLTINYRLASESVHYPAPLEDVLSGWQWLAEHVSSTGRRYLGGGSAGASLALAAAMTLRDAGSRLPDGLLLAYGAFHFPLPASSVDAQRDLAVLPIELRGSPAGMNDVFRKYAGVISNLPPYTAPGNHDLRSLPPVAIVVSEFDDLAQSSYLLVDQLAESGVPTRTHLAKGMLHGHLNWYPSPRIPEIDASIDFFADFIGRETADD